MDHIIGDCSFIILNEASEKIRSISLTNYLEEYFKYRETSQYSVKILTERYYIMYKLDERFDGSTKHATMTNVG